MSDIETERDESSKMARFLWQQLPYAVALVLSIAGVAYTNASRQPLVGYWEFLALAIGVVCVINKWPEAEGKEARLRLRTSSTAWATWAPCSRSTPRRSAQ